MSCRMAFREGRLEKIREAMAALEAEAHLPAHVAASPQELERAHVLAARAEDATIERRCSPGGGVDEQDAGHQPGHVSQGVRKSDQAGSAALRFADANWEPLDKALLEKQAWAPQPAEQRDRNDKLDGAIRKAAWTPWRP